MKMYNAGHDKFIGRITSPQEAEEWRQLMYLSGDCIRGKFMSTNVNPAFAVRDASIFLWDRDIYLMASEMMTKNSKNIFSGQPYEGHLVSPFNQLWILDSLVELNPEWMKIENEHFELEGRHWLAAILLVVDQERRLVYHHWYFCDYPDVSKGLKFVFYPEGFDYAANNPWTAEILGMLKFLKTELVDIAQYHPIRAERRRAIKENRVVPDIKVITLRKTEYQENPLSEHSYKQNCHYQVRAHYRVGYVPATGEYKPMLVHEHIRGDRSKPFKAPTKTIYSVIK